MQVHRHRKWRHFYQKILKMDLQSKTYENTNIQICVTVSLLSKNPYWLLICYTSLMIEVKSVNLHTKNIFLWFIKKMRSFRLFSLLKLFVMKINI